VASYACEQKTKLTDAHVARVKVSASIDAPLDLGCGGASGWKTFMLRNQGSAYLECNHVMHEIFISLHVHLWKNSYNGNQCEVHEA
jgi:hypothetical protein